MLYTATTDNPNFSLSSLEVAADTIASAVGPSGPNSDYLFALSEYLQKVGDLCGDCFCSGNAKNRENNCFGCGCSAVVSYQPSRPLGLPGQFALFVHAAVCTAVEGGLDDQACLSRVTSVMLGGLPSPRGFVVPVGIQ